MSLRDQVQDQEENQRAVIVSHVDRVSWRSCVMARIVHSLFFNQSEQDGGDRNRSDVELC